MNIIITAPSLDPGQNVSGISTVVRFIVQNKAHEYHHFELGKKDVDSRNFWWLFSNLQTWIKWFFLMFTIKKGTIIHFNLALNMLSILRDSTLILFARLTGKKLFIHLHGGDYLMAQRIPIFFLFLLRTLLQKKQAVVVLSELERNEIFRKFGCSRIYVLPNCIDLDPARDFIRTVSGTGSLNILFLGRITLSKGTDVIIRAFKNLGSMHKSIRFNLAGTGPEQESFIRQMCDNLGNRFEYLGIVSGAAKYELLKQNDIFILPSLSGEGLPMALLESMAFGLIPVVTNDGSMKQVIENGVNGVIVRKNEAGDIENAISRLIEDEDLRKMISRNARDYVFIHHDPEEYFLKLNEIYKTE